MENVSHGKFSSSIIEDEASLTGKVLAAMRGGASPRLFEVMAALVRHLHAFAREVQLTEEGRLAISMTEVASAGLP